MDKPYLPFIPPEYSNRDDNRIARSFYFLILALFGGFCVFLVERIFAGDTASFIITLASIMLLLSSLIMIRKHILKPAIFITTLALLMVVTLLSTLGQGIHDISNIGYPIILIISTLLLRKRSFFFLTGVSLLCVAWLVFGSAAGVYTPRPHGRGDAGDFVIVGTMLLIAAFTSYQIMASIRFSLKKAAEEIRHREKIGKTLQTNLAEKEMLLQEIHHRVKNTLNVIISLINLQKGKADTREKVLDAFEDIQNRIYSISLVHERLYTSGDLSHINMKEYVELMTRHLSTFFSTDDHIEIVSSVEDMLLEIDKAIPCGIILNETVTNAIKHAFPSKTAGKITISMAKDQAGTCTLKICDNGVGFSADVNMKNPESMGLQLISLLAQQLEGELIISTDSGTCFKVQFSTRKG